MEHILEITIEIIQEAIHLIALLHETGIMDAGLELVHEIIVKH